MPEVTVMFYGPCFVVARNIVNGWESSTFLLPAGYFLPSSSGNITYRHWE